jgi:hypothetical protein
MSELVGGLGCAVLQVAARGGGAFFLPWAGGVSTVEAVSQGVLRQ